MKTYAFFLLALLSSCKYCYTCRQEVAITTDTPLAGYPVGSTRTFEATKEQAELLDNQLIIKKDTVRGVIMTTNIKTRCWD